MHSHVHVGGLSAKVGLLCECYGRVRWPCGLHGCCRRLWSATLTKLCVGEAHCSKKTHALSEKHRLLNPKLHHVVYELLSIPYSSKSSFDFPF